MSEAPSISTPFLPPSLTILARNFSRSLAAFAASSALGASDFFSSLGAAADFCFGGAAALVRVRLGGG
jgi:hypothetical protein